MEDSKRFAKNACRIWGTAFLHDKEAFIAF